MIFAWDGFIVSDTENEYYWAVLFCLQKRLAAEDAKLTIAFSSENTEQLVDSICKCIFTEEEETRRVVIPEPLIHRGETQLTASR